MSKLIARYFKQTAWLHYFPELFIHFGHTLAVMYVGRCTFIYLFLMGLWRAHSGSTSVKIYLCRGKSIPHFFHAGRQACVFVYLLHVNPHLRKEGRRIGCDCVHDLWRLSVVMYVAAWHGIHTHTSSIEDSVCVCVCRVRSTYVVRTYIAGTTSVRTSTLTIFVLPSEGEMCVCEVDRESG